MAESGKTRSEAQLDRLANLLMLESRVRGAKSEIELSFTIVNDTISLVPASTALLWRNPPSGDFRNGEIFAVSSSPQPERNTPFAKWARLFCLALDERFERKSAEVETESLLEAQSPPTRRYVASRCLYLPLVHNDCYLGSLLLFRDQGWSDAELRILQQWSGTIAHGWHALRYVNRGLLSALARISRSRMVIGAAIVLLVSILLPVRLSVLAPAELKSGDSIVVRSPIQGVVDELHVESNESVVPGQLLVSLDDTALTTELEVSRQELEIARAEFRQSSQAAAFSEEAQANLQVRRITLEKLVAEVNYLAELLSRTQIHAQTEGTAIVENSEEFVGRPVQLGERLMTVVDVNALELEIWLPVGDDIQLDPGDRISFFPNVAPDRVYEGTLTTMDYEARLSPLGTLAYRARAAVNMPEGALSRIGMRGTSKLYGDRVRLFYYLFRRPISFVRQTLGI